MEKLPQVTVTFFNWTGSDFTCTWNSEPYLIKSGMSMILPKGIADTFAYHLAIRQMNEQKIDHARSDLRTEFEQRCFAHTSTEAFSKEKMEIELLNQKPSEHVTVDAVGEDEAEEAPVSVPSEQSEPVVAKKRVGRPPKEKKPEPEFEGI